MSQPYLGQIEAFSFGIVPKGWVACNGQTLAIQQYTALFSLLGTTYGGNGVTTFQLPNLQGRVANGQGTGPGLPNYNMGDVNGETTHTLTIAESPQHNHLLNVTPAAAAANNTNVPGPTVALTAATVTTQGSTSPFPIYAPVSGNPGVAMSGAAIGTNGGQPHPNMMPYLTLNFCIAMQGTFPSRG